jgi:hypothetical protein
MTSTLDDTERHSRLRSLQQSIISRGVSVPSDEPLLITTLLDLDMSYVIAANGAEDRMKRVWKLIATALGGVTPRIIFWNDDPINLPGWRWAPRSFLAKPNSSFNLQRTLGTVRVAGPGRPSRRANASRTKVRV